jgi:hypothetical protein
LSGVGDGTLSAPKQYLADVDELGAWMAMAIGDFDTNGDLDVAVVDERVQVLLGDGAGEFTALEPQPQNFAQVSALAVADLDSNGSLDLGVADLGGRGPVPALTVLPGLGDGRLGTADPNEVLSRDVFYDLVVGDLNHDQKPDLMGCGSKLEVFLSGSDGTLAPVCQASLSCWSLALGDLNDDSDEDVVVVRTEGDFYGASVLLGTGDGAFTIGQADAPTGR